MIGYELAHRYGATLGQTWAAAAKFSNSSPELPRSANPLISETIPSEKEEEEQKEEQEEQEEESDNSEERRSSKKRPGEYGDEEVSSAYNGDSKITPLPIK
jgi:hypothetical protein